MKLITLDEVYELYTKRKPCGFYTFSIKDMGITFEKHCDIIKKQGYSIQ